jgi:FkbM family methyltransferase
MKENPMPSFVAQLQALATGFHESTTYPSLVDLIQQIGALTGASLWSENEFRKGVILYGAGSIGAGAFDYFVKQDVKVLGFIDDTAGREEGRYCGLPILPLPAAMQIDCPIVISMKLWQEPAIRMSLLRRPCEAFAHHVFRTNLARLQRIADEFLDDDRSRLVFFTILKANILADYSLYRCIFEGDQYWAIPEFRYMPDIKGVMIDAGGYVGDTAEEFVWRTRGMFKQMHVFEPDSTRYQALLVRTKRLREEWALHQDAIKCIPAGLGDQDIRLPFFEHHSGADGSFLFAHGHDGGSLEVRTLDGYLEGSPVTFLKADIEGYEIPLILGASDSIKRHRPKVAICLYHRLTDLIDIPLLLKSLVPEYKMAVRHHSLSQDESVLYCWL